MKIIRTEKTSRPPNRSVSVPINSLASDPSKTGTAISKAVWVAFRWRTSRKRGANALTSPQAANETVRDIVPSASCLLDSMERRSHSAGFSLESALPIAFGSLTRKSGGGKRNIALRSKCVYPCPNPPKRSVSPSRTW